jgi:hypothetical protein
MTKVKTRGGAEATFNSRHTICSIKTSNGMAINHGPHGERQIITRRADGTRLVTTGGHRGYAEHNFTRHGRDYMRRTYVERDHVYARVYERDYYHNEYYYRYAPAYYYGPRFYGWAYRGWDAPVYWGWGWGGDPWYGYYGYYFAPYPVYAGPSFWITDFLLAANLAVAYESQQSPGADAVSDQGDSVPNTEAATNGDTNAVVLTPEVKQAIAEEVKAQLAAERDASTEPAPAPSNEQLPPALDPNYRTFVVSIALNEQMIDGGECTLTPGDILTRIDDTPDASQNVKVLVSASKKNDCHSMIMVSLQDLQDMHNDFRAKIDEGLGQLAKNQGKNGMPAAPAVASHANPDGQTQPDLTAQSDLQQQEKDADQTEKEVRAAADEGGGD